MILHDIQESSFSEINRESDPYQVESNYIRSNENLDDLKIPEPYLEKQDTPLDISSSK